MEPESLSFNISRWAPVFELAKKPKPLAQWRVEMAQALQRAAKTSYAAMVTCKKGGIETYAYDAYPAKARRVLDSLTQGFMASLANDAKYAPTFEFSSAGVIVPEWYVSDEALRANILSKVMKPSGLRSYVLSDVQAGQGQGAGFLALGDGQANEILLKEHGHALEDLSQTLGATFASIFGIVREFEEEQADFGHRLNGLTPREIEVAGLAAKGFSNINIGHRLKMSPNTVSVHLRNIYAKIGINNRTQLANLHAARSASFDN